MINRTAYDFFRANAGGWVGHSAEIAVSLARAEQRAEDEGLTIEWEDELDSWDGDCPPPAVHVQAACMSPDGECLASLGSIGLNSMRDPYVRVVEAELYSEALERIDEERERVTYAAAEELMSRATYAAG